MVRHITCTLLALALVLLIALPGLAQDKKAGGPPSPQDMQKMMAEMMKLGTPGPEHQLLAKCAGEWNTSDKSWMEPGGAPMESKGTVSAKMIYEGRYLQEEHHGDMMGMLYLGTATVGYDNFKKKYVMNWIDNMSTSMSMAEGTPDATGKIVTFLGKMDEPMTGEKNKDVKYVHTMVNDDTQKFEMYHKVGTPQEFKAMEMTYTRKK